ncbi:DUF998 domain-containing protein [Paractinoplanes globisporus]|uniref:DUF998 domain-containing protein n=1 Tax=Paractinoplanes globisporus TaxID=113565 RepID=A0ABW6WHM2_9ACTN|nr:DUF998 domain-containing protein [Actinoplanes globisporus]
MTTAPQIQGAPAATAPAQARKFRLAGLCLTLAGIGILMGSITAEALFGGAYTTHADTLSHLGASEPPDSVVTQPSATIFGITMLVTGALILAGAWLMYRAAAAKAASVFTALLGTGVFGVGLFPLTHPGPHTAFAMTAFFSGGIAVILSARGTEQPFRPLWTLLGAISLVSIALGIFLMDWTPVARLGEGGIERWNAYPIVLWLVAYGSYLTATCGRAKP